jgi:hypothetical protein
MSANLRLRIHRAGRRVKLNMAAFIAIWTVRHRRSPGYSAIFNLTLWTENAPETWKCFDERTVI